VTKEKTDRPTAIHMERSSNGSYTIRDADEFTVD
jgi:hypothetical protein